MADNKFVKDDKMMVIKMSIDELSEVCERVYDVLEKRAERAKKKYTESPDERTLEKHIETAKDAFAFLEMIKISEELRNEVEELRGFVQTLEQDAFDNEMPVLFAPPKKIYKN